MRLPGPLPLLLVVLTGCGMAGAEPESGGAAADGLPAPRPAPPLVGVEADGDRFELERLRGGPAVLVFYRASSCGLCRERLRALAASADDYDRRGARIVAVTGEAPEAARAMVEELGLAFPVVSVDRATLDRWAAWPAEAPAPAPAAFVLDAEGRIRYHQIGATAADRPSDVALLHTVGKLNRSAR